MRNLWQYRKLELIVWFVFGLLVSTSILILYTSYIDYNELINSSGYVGNGYGYKVIMGVSSTVLILSLLIVYMKRDYFFMGAEKNKAGLEQLFGRRLSTLPMRTKLNSLKLC